jgi:3-hydroxybutyrate dehydrogenase
MVLKNKVALVTGSTSGIGLAIASELAQDGYHIVINGFGEADAIEKERANIEKSYGVKCIYLGCDISKPEDNEKMIKDAEAQLGSVDILVNNAGIQFTAPVEEFPIEKWNQIISINLSGVFYGIHAALPGMKKRGYGRIVNIASAHGLVASAHKVAYVAAKHGVVGMTKVVAIEAGESNITCNAICPGWVETPLAQKQVADRAAREGRDVKDVEHEFLLDKQPNARWAQPSEIGKMVVYLVSDAARGINGSALSIDGGWTAG